MRADGDADAIPIQPLSRDKEFLQMTNDRREPADAAAGATTLGSYCVAPLGWLTPFRSINRCGLGNGKNES